MADLPQVSGKRLVNIFLKEGWTLVSQKGSHVKLRKVSEGRKK
jgi:predicted RNA binding protein YcfA (HicA-like mRNA interferase family)